MNIVLLPWMLRLQSPVSVVTLSPPLSQELMRQPVKKDSSDMVYITDDQGIILARVGLLESAEENSVWWRRLLGIRFDPNDTINATLDRISGAHARYVQRESINGHGETFIQFHALQ